MPVKKPRLNNEKKNKKPRAKKTPVKKTAPKTKARRQVKKEIASAVEAIPSFVTEQMQTEVKKEKHYTPPKNPTTQYHQAPKGSKTLLWLGVGIVTIIIFLMWILNIKTLFQDTSLTQSPENEIWENTTQDLSNVLSVLDELNKENALSESTEQIKKEFEQEQTEEKIKQTLSALLTSTTGNNTNSTSTEE